MVFVARSFPVLRHSSYCRLVPPHFFACLPWSVRTSIIRMGLFGRNHPIDPTERLLGQRRDHPPHWQSTLGRECRLQRKLLVCVVVLKVVFKTHRSVPFSTAFSIWAMVWAFTTFSCSYSILFLYLLPLNNSIRFVRDIAPRAISKKTQYDISNPGACTSQHTSYYSISGSNGASKRHGKSASRGQPLVIVAVLCQLGLWKIYAFIHSDINVLGSMCDATTAYIAIGDMFLLAIRPRSMCLGGLSLNILYSLCKLNEKRMHYRDYQTIETKFTALEQS